MNNIFFQYNATGITPEQAMYQIPSDMPNSVNAAIKASALVGTFCGQIVFGILADIYGRRSMFGLSMSILVFAALGQGTLSPFLSIYLSFYPSIYVSMSLFLSPSLTLHHGRVVIW